MALFLCEPEHRVKFSNLHYCTFNYSQPVNKLSEFNKRNNSKTQENTSGGGF